MRELDRGGRWGLGSRCFWDMQDGAEDSYYSARSLLIERRL
jgi:hypothetical protein